MKFQGISKAYSRTVVYSVEFPAKIRAVVFFFSEVKIGEVDMKDPP